MVLQSVQIFINDLILFWGTHFITRKLRFVNKFYVNYLIKIQKNA